VRFVDDEEPRLEPHNSFPVTLEFETLGCNVKERRLTGADLRQGRPGFARRKIGVEGNGKASSPPVKGFNLIFHQGYERGYHNGQAGQ